MISVHMEIEGLADLMSKLPDDSKSDAVVKRIIDRAGMRTVHAAQSHAPRRTGNLQRGIVYTFDEGAMEGRVTAQANYAAYVEFGTGLYGPKHERIDVGHAMRWPVGASGVGGFAADSGPGGTVRLTGTHTAAFGRSLSGSEGYAFAMSTAGMQPQPFMAPAWEDVQGDIAADLASAAEQLIGSGED